MEATKQNAVQLNFNLQLTDELINAISAKVTQDVGKAFNLASNSQQQSVKFLSRKEYADRMQISLGSVDNAIKRGEITPTRIGHRVLIEFPQPNQ